MRPLKAHRGETVQLFLEGINLQGMLVDVSRDAVTLRGVTATEPRGSIEVPGPVIVSTRSIVWAVVV